MNIEQIREDTPLGNQIFLNSAGSSLSPSIINSTITDYLMQEEKYGGYRATERHQERINQFYERAARLIGAKPHNVAFAHDATDAYIKALTSIDFKSGDIILTSQDDYASNQIQFISLYKRLGIEIVKIKTLENGDLDIENCKELIASRKPKLVAITHIPTNSGLIQDVEAIGQLCSDYNVLYLVDACQSVGQLLIDVSNIRCDFLSTTGRKFLRGPRGTGFLYVSDKVLERDMFPLMIDGRGAKWTQEFEFEILDSAKRFETWEKSYALLLGLSEAIDYALNVGLENIRHRSDHLMATFRNNLNAIPEVRIFDRGSKLSNILTFRKSDLDLDTLSNFLIKNRVEFSVSNLAWGLLDFQQKKIDGAIRLSPHYFNTVEELEEVVEVIRRM